MSVSMWTTQHSLPSTQKKKENQTKKPLKYPTTKQSLKIVFPLCNLFFWCCLPCFFPRQQWLNITAKFVSFWSFLHS